MKKYKLLKWYPSLPCWFKVGDTVIKATDGKEIYAAFSFNNKKQLAIGANQVEQYPEFWEKVVEKDYEILEVKYNGYLYNKYYENFDKTVSCGSITKVRRLSDGEVFTIGDKINYINCKAVRTIDKFEIFDSTIEVHDKHGNGYHINYIQKAKKPLFTTEDGVGIYEGDEYYNVHKEHMCVCYNSGAGVGSGTDKDRKYFSTEEKAKEYVDLHKPQYSEKDIEKAYERLSRVRVLGSPFLKINFLKLIRELKNYK